jgi:hypothetical protein
LLLGSLTFALHITSTSQCAWFGAASCGHAAFCDRCCRIALIGGRKDGMEWSALSKCRKHSPSVQHNNRVCLVHFCHSESSTYESSL